MDFRMGKPTLDLRQSVAFGFSVLRDGDLEVRD